MIDLTTPQPLEGAITSLSAKTPIGAVLKSADWARLPQALRESAFFASTMESIRVLQFMQDQIGTAIALGREQVERGDTLVTRSSFIGDVRELLERMGYMPQAGEEGTIRDFRTRGRLGLIFDIQTARAQGYADWKMGQDPDLLDAFPAQELVRKEARKVPRIWVNRWRDAGGSFYGGRMIALKNDPIWKRISRFGSPWPPFDYNSGMGLNDISRDEAEQLGVLKPGDEVQPVDADFNQGLQASVTDLSPRMQTALQTIFGDQVLIAHGKASWVNTKAN
jgi:hypothetical protein